MLHTVTCLTTAPIHSPPNNPIDTTQVTAIKSMLMAYFYHNQNYRANHFSSISETNVDHIF